MMHDAILGVAGDTADGRDRLGAMGRRRWITQIAAALALGVAAVVGLAVTQSAHAADLAYWAVDPGEGGKSVFVVSASAPNGACVTSGDRFSDEKGSTVSARAFSSSQCTDGPLGDKCTITVQGNNALINILDVRTCSWR